MAEYLKPSQSQTYSIEEFDFPWCRISGVCLRQPEVSEAETTTTMEDSEWANAESIFKVIPPCHFRDAQGNASRGKHVDSRRRPGGDGIIFIASVVLSVALMGPSCSSEAYAML